MERMINRGRVIGDVFAMPKASEDGSAVVFLALYAPGISANFTLPEADAVDLACKLNKALRAMQAARELAAGA